MEDPSFTRIVSERLVIRRFAAEDAGPLAAYRSDDAVARYQDWTTPYPIEEAGAFIVGLQGLAPGKPGTWFQFAVSLSPTDALIGDVALHTTRGDPRQGELGFTFCRAHQGRGYAAEAVQRVVEYAFIGLSMHRLFAITDVRNRAAQRLLERLRFRREGEFRESTWFKGAWASELLYAQLRSEFAPGPGVAAKE